jgi:hypothetical protein
MSGLMTICTTLDGPVAASVSQGPAATFAETQLGDDENG